ncbi:MAG: electron transfer flavoprotein subunit alpha/FixB family protein [Actinobacteria bacterium]|nr:electron transfer flavoprotein subunit alpha/FixB family protein [Actinomycetota bacterium]
MAELLVYSEKIATARELVAGGRQIAAALGLGVSAAALGPGAGAAASELAAAGADTVYVSEDAALEGWPADTVAAALVQIAVPAGAAIVLVGSTRRGKETAPRLAQRLGAGCVTDVNALSVEGDDVVAARYAFGGATVAREKVTTPVKVFAVMPKTFSAEGATSGAGRVETPTLTLESKVRVLDRRAREGDQVNLDAAPRIVGVGRGFIAREDLALGEQLAGALDAVVGCTKSLADFEWLGEDRIIGLSGAKTAPDLYIGVGVSGQIQHTVGVAGAKLIAAVNKDKEAPIFGMADYGLVGDLYEVVPALVERLKSV